ncbi:MAG: hypothetical protein KAT46_03295, partial [Deltaproteobacteria bacterium]|nr:hypothetical protein [Deltaproteobacteria bacterium]
IEGEENLKINLPSKHKRALYLGVILITSLTACLTYLPTLEADFVNWDDLLYISDKFGLETGSSIFTYLKWVATAVVASNWHPLTLLSFGLDYQLWGLNPFGYHLTNLILHALNTILVAVLTMQILERIYVVEEKLIKSFTTILVTTLLFALHPTHVESVAWVSERKDLLCAFFFLLSLITYLKWVQNKALFRSGYALSLLFFALALLSKPMAVTLPFVLLILDFYPLKRMEKLRESIKEKLPFFALSAVSVVTTLIAQNLGGAIKSLETVPFFSRILNAVHSYAFYLFKMIAPYELSPIYPFLTDLNITTPAFLASLALLIFISAICIYYRKKQKFFLSAWLYYLITLLPIIGIIQVGTQSAADRYMYLPSIAPFLLIGACLGFLIQTFNDKLSEKLSGSLPVILAITLAGVIIILASLQLATLTRAQISVWKDSLSLWNYQLNLYPDPVKSHGAYFNRGLIFLTKGNFELAIKDFNVTASTSPKNPNIFINRAIAYWNLKKFKEAKEDLLRTIDLNPTDGRANLLLGLIYIESKDNNNAKKYLKTASELGIKKASEILRTLQNKP